jgi:hypothetical protein
MKVTVPGTEKYYLKFPRSCIALWQEYRAYVVGVEKEKNGVLVIWDENLAGVPQRFRGI